MIILKAIGYSIIYGVVGTILFFCIGMYFEVSERETVTETKYDRVKKEYYKESVLVEEGISGNTTAYFAIVGLVLGLIVGVVMALDDTPKDKKDKLKDDNSININQNDTTK